MAVKIKGWNNSEKMYETVAERVRKFRDACPISEGWRLITSVTCDGDRVVGVASVLDPNGNEVATGHAEEIRGSTFVNKTSAVENCETSAIGRVLMAAGFGGGEFCSADELLLALKKQAEVGKVVSNTTKTGEPKTKAGVITPQSDPVAKTKSEPLPEIPEMSSRYIVKLREKLLEMGANLQETETEVFVEGKEVKGESREPLIIGLKKNGFHWNGKNWIRAK